MLCCYRMAGYVVRVSTRVEMLAARGDCELDKQECLLQQVIRRLQVRGQENSVRPWYDTDRRVLVLCVCPIISWAHGVLAVDAW